MEALSSSFFSATAIINSKKSKKKSSSSSSSSSSPSSLSSVFSPKTKKPSRLLLPRLHLAANSKGRDDEEFDHIHESKSKEMEINPSLLPLSPSLSLSPLSKDTAMGLVLSAATGKGWRTGSGMEGPSQSAGDAESTAAKVSTFPWSLFTKSPRRRMLIAFTCNICTQRTTRAINPHAYTDGTVFVQCCGCNAYHKLVDNLNLFDGMKCYLNSTFKYRGNQADVNFEYRDIDDADDGFFGI